MEIMIIDAYFSHALKYFVPTEHISGCYVQLNADNLSFTGFSAALNAVISTFISRNNK